jgi:hypothetical protein
MLVDARHPALEDRKVAFDGLGVGFAANPFFLAVVNRFVTGELPADRTVHIRLISAEMAGSVGVVENDLANLASGYGLDLDGTSFAPALNQGDDLALVAVGALFLPTMLGMQNQVGPPST